MGTGAVLVRVHCERRDHLWKMVSGDGQITGAGEIVLRG
jgi:hypothetical protein